jgi:hypothetical protein
LLHKLGYKVLIFSFVPHRALPLTARQYGEVVLPDAALLQSCPGRLQSGPGASLPAGRQGGYGVVFAVMVQILTEAGRVAVQF